MVKKFFGIFIFLSIVSGCLAQKYPVFTHADTLRGKLTPERACYNAYYYDLHLKINPEDHSISGYNVIAFKALERFNVMQVDLFKNMVIDSILFGHNRLEYIRDGNAVFVEFSPRKNKVGRIGRLFFLNEGKVDSIKICYHGKPQVAKTPPWDGGFVWAKDSLGKPWVGVACEGTGASLWWPCKDHLSDKPDSMRMTFDVPSGLMCVSNGRLRSEKNIDNNYTRFTWFVSYPIINYDVTFNLADYAHISDYYVNNKDTLTLDYYVLSYNKDKAQKQFEQVKPMLACYEKFFGKYPFYRDGYKLVEANYWGMEHQSCVEYGNHYHNNEFGFDFIIIHESAHEWWGNSLSCSDPADMWLHEAFATYAEALYIECTQDYKTSVKYLYTQQKRIGNKYPIIGPYDVNFQGTENDDDEYFKGTWMLQTFRHVLNNDSLFFSIFRGLQEKFKYSSTNTEEVIAYINKITGKDYTPFFNEYLHHSSPPIFEYKVKSIPGIGIMLTYRWDSVVKGFEIPVTIHYIGNHDTLVPPVTITPTTKWQTIKLNGWFSADVNVDLDDIYLIPKKDE